MKVKIASSPPYRALYNAASRRAVRCPPSPQRYRRARNCEGALADWVMTEAEAEEVMSWGSVSSVGVFSYGDPEQCYYFTDADAVITELPEGTTVIALGVVEEVFGEDWVAEGAGEVKIYITCAACCAALEIDCAVIYDIDVEPDFWLVTTFGRASVTITWDWSRIAVLPANIPATGTITLPNTIIGTNFALVVGDLQYDVSIVQNRTTPFGTVTQDVPDDNAFFLITYKPGDPAEEKAIQNLSISRDGDVSHASGAQVAGPLWYDDPAGLFNMTSFYNLAAGAGSHDADIEMELNNIGCCGEFP